MTAHQCAEPHVCPFSARRCAEVNPPLPDPSVWLDTTVVNLDDIKQNFR